MAIWFVLLEGKDSEDSNYTDRVFASKAKAMNAFRASTAAWARVDKWSGTYNRDIGYDGDYADTVAERSGGTC